MLESCFARVLLGCRLGLNHHAGQSAHPGRLGHPLAVAPPGRSHGVAVGGLDILQYPAVAGQRGSDGLLPGGLGNLDGLPVCGERRVRVLPGAPMTIISSPGPGGGTGTGSGLPLSALPGITVLSSMRFPPYSRPC